MTACASNWRASYLASLKPELRQKFLASLSRDEAAALLYDWRFWARPEQLAPAGDWRTWLVMAGRGFGKTRTCAEYIQSKAGGGACGRIALVGRTAADVRDVMVEGESGLLAIAPPWARPRYEPSKRRLTWPNGAMATTYTSEKPDQLRGPQHDGAWADELAAWRYPEAWDQLMFGLRLGTDPRCVVGTTPRPTRIIKELVADSTTYVTRGSTFDNRANLAPAFINQIVKRYQGTRLGRQELYAEVLDDNPGALWRREQLESLMVTKAPALQRIVVAIDPAGSAQEGSDETGIVVAGRGVDGHLYVLDDLSLRGKPHAWAGQAVSAYHKYKADRIVAEVNNGGDMVEATIRTVDSSVPYKSVNASRGKVVRAEPVASLYEQKEAHHVGMFAELEDQLCQWEPLPGAESPDRLDALVWAATELMLDGQTGPAAILI